MTRELHTSCTVNSPGPGRGKEGEGSECPIRKGLGKLVLSLRDVNQETCSQLGCSGRNASSFSSQRIFLGALWAPCLCADQNTHGLWERDCALWDQNGWMHCARVVLAKFAACKRLKVSRSSSLKPKVKTAIVHCLCASGFQCSILHRFRSKELQSYSRNSGAGRS